MTTFPVPLVALNANSWGPPDINMDEANPNAPGSVCKYASLPYAPFGRSDRLGRAADFASSGRGYGHQGRGRQSGGYQGGGGRGFQRGGGQQGGYQGGGRGYQQGRGRGGYQQGRGGYQQGRGGFQQGGRGRYDRYNRHNNFSSISEDKAADGEESFQLVDTTKTQTTKRFTNPTARRRQHSAKLRQINARRQAAGGGPGANIGVDKLTGRSGGRSNYHRGYRRGGYNNRVDRQASVSVQPDWKQVEELDLAKITKNLVASTTIPDPEDVLWCGFLDPYNENYDKITARQPISLKRMEHKEFYPVTTTDDPVLEKLAIDGQGQVFITDTILAHLMTCTRSVYPWDIVIQKLPNGTLFFDKRDNSQFDYLTVHETSYNPPLDDSGINTPERLGLEATMINQNFSQQILKKSGRNQMDLPNPFFDPEENEDEKMEPSSTAFRYRKFKLDENTTLVCRTELHGMVKKTQYMTAFALNEYTPLPKDEKANSNSNQTNHSNNSNNQSGISWRDKIDSQRGAVLATELKNNSFKLAKWTAQSLLSGADQMKIGFVSRTAPKNAYEHVILATQFYRPKDFATQITLSEGQMWAMIRMFVQLLQKKEEGKYVLMRNPNKALLTLHKVPQETFEDEE